MAIYLIQHAESKPKEDDPERPLTEDGYANITKIASYVKQRIGISPKVIYHSGKLRAEQTAGVLGKYLEPAEGPNEVDGLEPMADPRIWADRLAKNYSDIMLVGHLPHLGKLAGLLLNGDESKNVVNFRNAGIVSFSRNEDGNWMIDWMIIPSIV